MTPLEPSQNKPRPSTHNPSTHNNNKIFVTPDGKQIAITARKQWKQCYVDTPLPYFIVSASSVSVCYL